MGPEKRSDLEHLLLRENTLRQQGFALVAGVDEAGRGPLAGPVVAAACIIREGAVFEGVNDSKRLSPKRRGELFLAMQKSPDVIIGVGIVDHDAIDSINIYQATIVAMLAAIADLEVAPDYLLVDGLKLPHPTTPSEKVIRGDATCFCIAAASIIAKETRDRLMEDYHHQWPHYGFDRHKGYGTEKHMAALAEHGPCFIHRRSFAPVRALCGGKVADVGV